MDKQTYKKIMCSTCNYYVNNKCKYSSISNLLISNKKTNTDILLNSDVVTFKCSKYDYINKKNEVISI